MVRKKKEAKEKPLEKMTAKELRELALTIPEISGVHAMNKIELLGAIKSARGITDEAVKKTESSVRDIKAKIRQLKVRREEAVEQNAVDKVRVLRRRISRLKKRTRRAA